VREDREERRFPRASRSHDSEDLSRACLPTDVFNDLLFITAIRSRNMHVDAVEADMKAIILRHVVCGRNFSYFHLVYLHYRRIRHILLFMLGTVELISTLNKRYTSFSV